MVMVLRSIDFQNVNETVLKESEYKSMQIAKGKRAFMQSFIPAEHY